MSLPHKTASRKRQAEKATSIPITDLQELARKGKLRWRGQGEIYFLGFQWPYNGNLEALARDIPTIYEDPWLGLYRDADGFFFGPADPALITPNDSADAQAVWGNA